MGGKLVSAPPSPCRPGLSRKPRGGTPGTEALRALCGGVGEPPPALSQPVGEAQLLQWLGTQVSGQDTPTGCCCGDGSAFLPPPPWLLEPWAREAGVCPTQA